jgi:hypothetical protein
VVSLAKFEIGDVGDPVATQSPMANFTIEEHGNNLKVQVSIFGVLKRVEVLKRFGVSSGKSQHEKVLGCLDEAGRVPAGFSGTDDRRHLQPRGALDRFYPPAQTRSTSAGHYSSVLFIYCSLIQNKESFLNTFFSQEFSAFF